MLTSGASRPTEQELQEALRHFSPVVAELFADLRRLAEGYRTLCEMVNELRRNNETLARETRDEILAMAGLSGTGDLAAGRLRPHQDQETDMTGGANG